MSLVCKPWVSSALLKAGGSISFFQFYLMKMIILYYYSHLPTHFFTFSSFHITVKSNFWNKSRHFLQYLRDIFLFQFLTMAHKPWLASPPFLISVFSSSTDHVPIQGLCCCSSTTNDLPLIFAWLNSSVYSSLSSNVRMSSIDTVPTPPVYFLYNTYQDLI